MGKVHIISLILTYPFHCKAGKQTRYWWRVQGVKLHTAIHYYLKKFSSEAFYH